MTSSVKLLAHPLLHALGWTLIHFCWQGAAIAVVLWCVLGVLAGRSPRLRYAAACLAMALMVALPTATFARLAVANYRAGRITWIADSESDGALVFAAGAQEIAQPWTARAVAQIDQWMPWLLAAWFAGAIFFVARLNYGLILARRLKCDDTCEPPSDLARRFDELRRRLGIERAVRLLHSPRVEVPTVIGWLRPVVLIPVSCLTGLSTEQIEAIFCHELAHVRRHDYLISVFQSVAETLLFYHPAVWWVSQQVRRERECCCDEVAVANSGDVLAYARALSHLEERRAAAPEFVLGANGGVLAMRIKRLVGAKDDVQTSQVASAVLLALMLAGAAGYAATEARAQMRAKVAALHNEPVLATESGQLLALNEAPPAFRMMSAAAQADATQQGGLHGIYKSWLDEDVVYIITPQEREAYLNLTNDDERDAFITQFWARRDAPGAPAGSFREQHYARIAYANEHFASDTQVGWRTDRGRIYIVNGKPYEIDSHPSGGEFAGVARSDPFEIWHYRGAKGGVL